MEATTKQTIWDLLENPPTYAESVANLIEWSMNFDYAQRPYLVFLDLIGYSSEQFGEALTNLNNLTLGYMELSYLADALQEYSSDPTRVSKFIEAIDESERDGE